jgi:divalent metal cation (Fe/Co/Zn/Cd) transporter
MAMDADERRRERIERLTLRAVGISFLALGAYVTWTGVGDLIAATPPETSVPGIVLACLSLVVMPLLSRAKRRVAQAMGSHAMRADAKQTEFCTYLSAILLGGLTLNAVLGWWWADPIAGLVMVPIIAREGFSGLRGDPCCD